MSLFRDMLIITNRDPINIQATVSGIPLYLDNHSYIRLAGSERALQDRFIAAINAGSDLLFSVSNAAEISRSKGDSSERIQSFLDRIGVRWFPVELNPYIVTDRELHDIVGGDAFAAKDLLKAMIAMHGREGIGKCAEELFSIGFGV